MSKVYQIKFPDYVTIQIQSEGSAKDLAYCLNSLKVGLNLRSGTVLNPSSYLSISKTEDNLLYTYQLNELIKE